MLGGGGGGGVHTEFPGVVFGIRICIMYSYGSLLYVSGCSHAVRMVRLRCHHSCLGVISALQMSLNVRVCSPCCPEGIYTCYLGVRNLSSDCTALTYSEDTNDEVRVYTHASELQKRG